MSEQEAAEPKYTVDELRQYIDETIAFEVTVNKSANDEPEQFVLLMVKDVKECLNGNSVIVGVNLMRLREAKYNMAQEKAKPYRSYSINHIKYGSIKPIVD